MSTEGMQDSERESRPDNRLGARGVALALGVPFMLALGGLAVLLAIGNDGNPEGDSITTCEAAVKERLKAPGTADFQSGARESSPDHWLVVGSVDAQNSFGAQVRTDFTCRVAWDPKSKDTVLQSVDIKP